MASEAKIRQFVWSDTNTMAHLFNEVNGLTNTEKEVDAEFMRQYLEQPSCKPEEHCFIAEVNGEPVGFALISAELRISRTVASGGVVKSHRGKGIELCLLRTAIDHAKALGAKVLHVDTSFENADSIKRLESEGFYEVRCYWQMRWEQENAPELSLPNGYSVRSFRLDEDEATLTELQNISFGENWGFAPNTVEEIHARVRLNRVTPEGIIFIMDGDRPIAYNWTLNSSDDKAAVGWVAMTGVHPDYRGKGLGRSVVVAGMRYLKEQGVDGIELEVDAANPSARELYLKLGFVKIGETVWYEKDLKA